MLDDLLAVDDEREVLVVVDRRDRHDHVDDEEDVDGSRRSGGWVRAGTQRERHRYEDTVVHHEELDERVPSL